MMDRRVAMAFDPYPVGVRVMGERLSRLTLRHLFTLRVQENPMATQGRELTATDVMLAARVCGARSEEDLGERLREVDSGLGRLRIFARAWRWRRSYVREMLKLRSWLDGELAGMPEILPGVPGKRKKYQTDWVLVLVAKLIREGMGRTEAWWTPLAEAGHLRLAWEEMDGAEFTVLTDELRAELEEMGHKF